MSSTAVYKRRRLAPECKATLPDPHATAEVVPLVVELPTAVPV
jgi:hypothetical protein